jgi:LuxR family transcriptional regulator, maltose regulon positive regulatory protein
METLELKWLGPPRVKADGRPVRLETRKISALLAILSVDRRPQSREYLANLLWPEFDSRRAPANLRRALSSLQASLGTDWVQADREAIALGGPGQVCVDIEDALLGVREARAHHPKQGERLCAPCVGKLQEAARLHRGDFLEGFNLKDCPGFDQWQMGKREELSREMGWALERLAEVHGEAGRWEEGIGAARRWLALDELHEGAQRTLMFLYARSGKRSAALRQYDECARVLHTELGQEPEEATRSLYERIRLRKLEPPRSEAAAAASPPIPTPQPGKGSGATASADQLSTRLRPPPRRPALVERSRLMALLDEGTRRALTLVSAPAGFGKTTLLAEWARGCGLPVAWLSLEEADSDGAHLLASMAAALRRLDPEIGVEASQMLHAMQAAPLSAVVGSLLEDLARRPAERVLVLDDCHLVSKPEVEALLADIVQRLPEELHLYIATRVDPGLPLARMRARGQLAEVRAEDLRFRPEEAAAFLRQVMGLELQEGDIALLEQRTEGWAAGLQMAALSLQGRTDPSQYIRSFGGSHRYIMDYLVGEVLEGQTTEVQEFLLGTSILERFCSGLCDEILGRHGSQAMLEKLDRANLFLVPLDEERTWYRYHHLFAELLRHRLRQGRPAAEIEDLHLRAGRWLDENGDPAEAMRHLLTGRKHAEAMLLIDRWYEPIMSRGGLGTLLEWARQLPGEEVSRSPEACVTIGTVYVWAGRPEEAERLFTRACAHLAREAEGDSSPRARSLRGRAAIMRAYVADVAGASTRAIELAHEGEKLLPPDTHHNHRSLIPYILCRAYRYRGDLDQSIAYARVMIGMARASGNVWGLATAVHELIWLCRHQGRLREADQELEEFDTFPREAGSAGPIAKLTASRGDLQRERGDLDAADHTILVAQEDVERWGLPADIYFCHLLRCRLALSQGDPASAAEEVSRADKIARGASLFASMFALMEVERARVFLAKGMLGEALAWMEGYSIPDESNQMNREVVSITHARILIAAGRGVQASELLCRLAATAEAGKRYGRLIEILVLQAIAETGEAAAAALHRALELAEPEGFVRVFLDEGEPVIRRLHEMLDRADALAPRLASYARRLISRTLR